MGLDGVPALSTPDGHSVNGESEVSNDKGGVCN